MAARKTRTKQETRKGKVASGERAPSARLSPEHRRSVNDGRSSADRALALRSRSLGAVTVQSASRTPRSGGTQLSLRRLEVGGGWRDQPRVVTRKDGKGRMPRGGREDTREPHGVSLHHVFCVPSHGLQVFVPLGGQDCARCSRCFSRAATAPSVVESVRHEDVGLCGWRKHHV
jgi:hypothetical protein